MGHFLRFTLPELLSHGLRASLALLLAILPSLVLVNPASAGTLTSPTWSTDDVRAKTGGNTYTYGFTTATAGTVSRVTATVPAGTHGGNRYLTLPGTVGNYAYTADASGASVGAGTALDVRIRLRAPDWTPGSEITLASKWRTSGSQQSWAIGLRPNGALRMSMSNTGGGFTGADSSVLGVSDGSIKWIRGVYESSTGFSFYSSDDGMSWTAQGTSGAGAGTIFAGQAAVEIGSSDLGAWANANTDMYFASVASSINGTTTSASSCIQPGVRVCFDPNTDAGYGSATWTSGGPTAETWTVGRNGTNPADIVSNLERFNSGGIDPSALVRLREIDRLVSYNLYFPQSIASGSSIFLQLRGLVNTATTGSYPSTITTYDNAGTPAVLDSATTASVAITAPTNPTATGVLGQFDGNGNPTYTTSNSGLSAQLVNAPGGTAIDAARHLLFLADSNNNRILVYRLTPANELPSPATAFAVLGQTSMATNSSGVTASTLSNPKSLAFDATNKRLFVADFGNRRVLVFNVTNIDAGMAAANVLGQTNFISNGYGVSENVMGTPNGVTYDGVNNRIFVSDYECNRVLVWNTSSITDGQSASFVLGQSSFYDGSSSTSNTRLAGPAGVTIDAAHSRLYVSDANVNRVVVFDTTSLSNGKTMTNVLGQPNFTSTTSATSATGLNFPNGLSVDQASQRLWVTDTANQRILQYDVSTVTNGKAATAVFGQTSFTDNGGGTAKDRLNNPRSVGYDTALQRIFVSDVDNGRVVSFDVPAPNAAPGAPTSLAQKREYDGSNLPSYYWLNAIQAAGGTKGVTFTALATDTDAGDTSALCVEVKPDTGILDGSGVLCGVSVSAGAGVTVSFTQRGWSDGIYKWRAFVKDSAGVTSPWTIGPKFGIDTVAPAMAPVLDGATIGTDAAFNAGSLSTLGANWAGSTDATAGIYQYGLSFGTTPGGTDVGADRPVGGTADVNTWMNLRTGLTYYANVYAVDYAGNVSTVSTSNGQQVLPSIAFTVGASSLNFTTYPTSTASLAMTTQTNAYGGYNLTFQMPNLLTAGTKTIPAFTAPWTAPAAWTGTGLGFTSDDTSVLGSSGYAGAKYAGLPAGTSARVADHASGVTGTALNETFNASFRMTVDGTQAAGAYGGTLVVTCNPSF